MSAHLYRADHDPSPQERIVICPDCAGLTCELCSATIANCASAGDTCRNTMPPGPKCKKAKMASAMIANCETCGGVGKVKLETTIKRLPKTEREANERAWRQSFYFTAGE